MTYIDLARRFAKSQSPALPPGDHVYVLAQPEDKALIQLMFGRPEVE